MRTASTIQEVIDILDDIIIAETTAQSTLAYFPALYRKVTIKIQEGIIKGAFENNPRMERLDVIFANRYLEAYFDYKEGKPITKSWQHAFDQIANSNMLILQHILIGINAHINLDLGIITSETAGAGQPLQPLKNDFDHINDILASMVNDMQASINKVSPLFNLFEWIGKGREDKLAAFSIKVARDGAWLFAQKYHDNSDQAQCLDIRDRSIAALGDKLANVKSKFFSAIIKVVRIFESNDVPRVVQTLRGI